MHNNGFTLFESVSVLAIIAIIACLSYPNFKYVRQAQQLQNAASELYQFTLSAQRLALLLDRDVSVWLDYKSNLHLLEMKICRGRACLMFKPLRMKTLYLAKDLQPMLFTAISKHHIKHLPLAVYKARTGKLNKSFRLVFVSKNRKLNAGVRAISQGRMRLCSNIKAITITPCQGGINEWKRKWH